MNIKNKTQEDVSKAKEIMWQLRNASTYLEVHAIFIDDPDDDVAATKKNLVAISEDLARIYKQIKAFTGIDLWGTNDAFKNYALISLKLIWYL